MKLTPDDVLIGKSLFEREIFHGKENICIYFIFDSENDVFLVKSEIARYRGNVVKHFSTSKTEGNYTKAEALYFNTIKRIKEKVKC